MIKDSAYIERDKKEQASETNREKLHGMVKAKQKKDAATIAPDAGRDVTDITQAGRWLSPLKMKKALSTLNAKLRFEVSVADPTKTGIYLLDRISNLGTYHHGLKFICGMESGYSPEFSIRTEKNGVMSGEVRGWRTVLAMLIKQRLIQKYEAENLFKVNFGRESENWSVYVN